MRCVAARHPRWVAGRRASHGEVDFDVDARAELRHRRGRVRAGVRRPVLDTRARHAGNRAVPDVLEALHPCIVHSPAGLAGVPVVRFGPACPAAASRVRPAARVRPSGVHPTGRIMSAQG